MKTTSVVVFLAFVFCITSTANATIVSYHVTATVDNVYDPDSLLAGSVLVGDTLTSILQYDLGLLDSDPDTDTGFYFASPPGSNHIEGTNRASGFFETIDFFDVIVVNDADDDFISFFTTGDTTPSTLAHPGVDYVDFEIDLHDFDGTSLSDGTLPDTLILDDFEVAMVEFSAEKEDAEFAFFVDATITGILKVSMPGDFNGDGGVDRDDLVEWQAGFGDDNSGDADGDGDTDGNDFLIWQSRFGSGSGSVSASIPEPSSWLLVAMSLALCLMKWSGSRFIHVA